MKKTSLEGIKNMPEYKELLKKRYCVAIPLTLLTMAVYFGYVLVIAFKPEIFGQPFFGSTTSIGIALGIGINIFSFLLVAAYVFYANKILQPLTIKIQNKAK